jgi:hypothetical protein
MTLRTARPVSLAPPHRAAVLADDDLRRFAFELGCRAYAAGAAGTPRHLALIDAARGALAAVRESA